MDGEVSCLLLFVTFTHVVFMFQFYPVNRALKTLFVIELKLVWNKLVTISQTVSILLAVLPYCLTKVIMVELSDEPSTPIPFSMTICGYLNKSVI